MVRTRFAPSPTGDLHVGNARTAVLNWLFARRHGGAFVLRVEDTDRERTVPGAESAILDDLRWLGLDWDEGPDVGGPHAPYRQSERGAIYRDHAGRLLDAGLAFRCYCTAEELERRRERAIARGEPAGYPGTCRELTGARAAALEREGRRPSIRFRVPGEGAVEVEDVVRGTVRFDAAELGDFVLLRSDGVPTYNFAVVVDDALMEISHVIRGAGHLSNTPRQVLLYLAFRWAPPVFAHVPTVLGPDRRKLSKRHGARPLADYRREGYHPDALVNYLSLLSWSSPSGEEFLPRERLVREVSLERIGSADVVFDPEKLRWLSAKHLETLPPEELTRAAAPFIDRARFPIPDERLPVAVGAVRTHLATLSDIEAQLEPFVADPAALAAARRERPPTDEETRVLRAARDALAAVEPWTEPAIDAAVRAAGRAAGARGRALFEPLRLALTGRSHGPPLPAVIAVLGRETALLLVGQALGEGTS